MIIIISPAKIQNFEPQQIVTGHTMPRFMDEAEQLIESLKKLSRAELASLLGINANLAKLNADRHFNWERPFTPENAKQAALVFNGEVFHGLDAKSLAAEDFDYLQSHLRIFSGLYGILRPLDLIQPYRLDIGTNLKTSAGNNLYTYWGSKITEAMNADLAGKQGPQTVLNLASAEYMKSINRKSLQAEVIDFEFLQYKDDKLKPVVIYVKKARGMMARYVIENRIENVEDLKGFNAEGYWYNPQLSTERKLVFTR
ncbi:MAG TPA: peroxide stress protein YaaA [Paludibacter sp.]|nr:peroxide stress protein YaaA [Paludibacter sp.]